MLVLIMIASPLAYATPKLSNVLNFDIYGVKLGMTVGEAEEAITNFYQSNSVTFKIEKTIGIFGMLILSSIVLWAIGLIPYVGSAINIITSLIGLGIIVTNIIPVREKTKKTKKTDKIEK